MIDFFAHFVTATKKILNVFYYIPQYDGFQKVLVWLTFTPLMIQRSNSSSVLIVKWPKQWNH